MFMRRPCWTWQLTVHAGELVNALQQEVKQCESTSCCESLIELANCATKILDTWTQSLFIL